MKRLALVFLVLSLWSVEAKAQMQQGSWLLEGSAGLERTRMTNLDTDEKYTPTTGYSLNPKAGFFVADNLAIGVSGIFGNSWSRNRDYDQNIPSQLKKSNSITYGAGLFVRKFMPVNENLSFFAEAGSEIFWVNPRVVYNEPAGVESGLSRRTLSAQAVLGLQYLISPKVGVHLQTNLLQYQKAKTLEEFGIDQSEFRAGFLINPRFGLTLFL